MSRPSDEEIEYADRQEQLDKLERIATALEAILELLRLMTLKEQLKKAPEGS